MSDGKPDSRSTEPRLGPDDTPAAAGLPGAPAHADRRLRLAGIDPDRLAILHLGLPGQLLHYAYPPWIRRMALGFGLWLVLVGLEYLGILDTGWITALLTLATGLIILQAACDALITATERLAALKRWAHYIAGTVTEILSTIPELVAIAFVVPISPATAFVMALITIYNNALVFSLYSFFLPKNQEGKYLMPRPITEAGTQILIAGAALGLTLGLVLLVMASHDHPKQGFNSADLMVFSVILLLIFVVYMYKLISSYADEEEQVREVLDLSEADIERRQSLVYRHVRRSGMFGIVMLFLAGVAGAFVGGERVSHFANVAIGDLGLNHIHTALLLAVFAGMSEYVILWKSHRKQEYGIALANAFGGITQVMYLVLPFTLMAIAAFALLSPNGHAELPISFSVSNVLLLIFLAPTFFVLAELIREDHTLGLLDTTIMTAIFVLLLLLLTTYGANASSAMAAAGA
jgi:hypothetical protein